MRYIDADKLLELYDYQELNEMINAYARKGVDKKKWNIPIGVVKQNIKDMPTADVRENVRGEWEDAVVGTSTGYTYHEKRCSICGHSEVLPMNFCPNCGADMRGGKQ